MASFELRIFDWSSDVCSSYLAGTGMLLGREHQVACALAEYEPVAAGVPRTRDAGGVAPVVAAGRLGQRHHVGEGGHRQRVDRGLRAADDDYVGATEADLVQAPRDGLEIGRASGRERVCQYV